MQFKIDVQPVVNIYFEPWAFPSETFKRDSKYFSKFGIMDFSRLVNCIVIVYI